MHPLIEVGPDCFEQGIGKNLTTTCSSKELPTAESFAFRYHEFNRANVLVWEMERVLTYVPMPGCYRNISLVWEHIDRSQSPDSKFCLHSGDLTFRISSIYYYPRSCLEEFREDVCHYSNSRTLEFVLRYNPC